MSSKNSSITSSAAAQPSSTGTALSSSGSARLESSSLARLHREEVDRRLHHALQQLNGSLITFRLQDGETVGLKTTKPLSPSELVEASRIVENGFRPAPEETLAIALHNMRLMTRGRDNERGETDGAAEIAAWVQRLKAYPADVAVSVVQDWPKKSSFWPTWRELQDDLEKAVSQRRMLRHYLNQEERRLALEPKRLNANEADTPERRAQVVNETLAKLAQDTGMKLTAHRKREDLVQGRVKAGSDARERTEAQARLDELEADIPKFTLSPEAMKIFDKKG